MNQINKKKILVADDERHVRLLIRSMLGKDCIVLEANDGKEAIHAARTQRPDLILMDMLMPEIDGLTACFAIKANQATKGIPVVMLTGVGYELNKKLADGLGADGYITKPFSLQDLLEVVSQLLPGTK